MRAFSVLISTSTALAMALVALPTEVEAKKPSGPPNSGPRPATPATAPAPAPAPTPAPTPAPAPTPSPSPTPTPAPVVGTAAPPAAATATNASLEDLTVSQAFPAWQSTVKYQYPTSGPNAGKPSGFGNHAKVTASIRYDATTQSYIVRDTGSVSATSTFAPANIVAAESDATHTVYRKSNGGATETLRLLNPGAGNPLIALTYASYGHWRKTTPGGAWNGDTAQSDTYFVYGIKTTSAQMPRTGSASYSTVLDGTFANKTALYTVSGTGSLTANFGTGSLGFSATPVGTPASGPVLAFGTINGSGSINFNAASFGASGNNGTYKMDLSGYFFGPTAQEIGAVFRLSGGGSGPNSGNGNGAMVGKQ